MASPGFENVIKNRLFSSEKKIIYHFCLPRVPSAEKVLPMPMALTTVIVAVLCVNYSICFCVQRACWQGSRTKIEIWSVNKIRNTSFVHWSITRATFHRSGQVLWRRSTLGMTANSTGDCRLCSCASCLNDFEQCCYVTCFYGLATLCNNLRLVFPDWKKDETGRLIHRQKT